MYIMYCPVLYIHTKVHTNSTLSHPPISKKSLRFHLTRLHIGLLTLSYFYFLTPDISLEISTWETPRILRLKGRYLEDHPI